MSIKTHGHTFVKHGLEEMICWSCGFVIWRCDSENDVVHAMKTVERLVDYTKQKCPKSWHGWNYELIGASVDR